MATFPKSPSYSIFVRFRRSRLALRRGIPRLEDALAIAEQMRAARFHDRSGVFVVREPEGTVIPLAPVSEEGRRSAPAASAPSPSSAPPSPAAPSRTPVPARPGMAHEVQAVLALQARAARLREILDRAQAAQARLDQAFSASTRTLEGMGVAPPADLRRTHATIGALRTSWARSLASFEHVTLLAARRLETTWTEMDGAVSKPEEEPPPADIAPCLAGMTDPE
jgi:hypothetical protein